MTMHSNKNDLNRKIMSQSFSSIAIIPARGGSKRIPRKNLYPINGRPILGWVIETALSAKVFDEVVVSSEDDEILSVAESFGARAFRRSAELADDNTHVGPVIEECVKKLPFIPDSICLLFATGLLLRPEYLVAARELLIDDSADSVLSIAEYDSPIQRAYEMDNLGHIQMAHPEYFNYRSQDLPKRYRDAGIFSWWKSNKKLENKIGIVLPKYLAVDIDTTEDLKIASAFFNLDKSEFPSNFYTHCFQ